MLSKNSHLCYRRWEKVLSDILDRMCIASRKVVQFINVIYGEANALPEPQSFRGSTIAFPAYLSGVFVVSIEFCFTYSPRK